MDQFLRVAPDPSKPKTSNKQKNKSQGPFYFFMMDKKAEWMAEGRWDESKGMKRLAEECQPLWAMLKTSQALMEPYIKKACEAKSRDRAGDLASVWDSSGRSLADIRREAKRVRERLENMTTDIRETVARAGHNVKNKRFFVIHFNYLCKTDKDFYIPCEAAAVQFSVEEGVIKVRISSCPVFHFSYNYIVDLAQVHLPPGLHSHWIQVPVSAACQEHSLPHSRL